MEKKDKTILNNRPQVENLNKANQAWGLHTEESMNVYTVILAVVSVVLAVFFFVGGSVLFGFIFLGLAALLVFSVFISKKIVARLEAPGKEEKQPTMASKDEEVTDEKE